MRMERLAFEAFAVARAPTTTALPPIIAEMIATNCEMLEIEPTSKSGDGIA